MKLLRLMVVLAGAGHAGPALAQAATVFCANERITVERQTLQQVQSRLGHARVCIIGPSFDFQPDGVTWVRNNLGKSPGDSCRCS